MTKEQQQVKEFMNSAGQRVPEYLHVPTVAVKQLRNNLIIEELYELAQAQNKDDVVAVSDALADLLYVVLGTAVAWGIDLEPVFQEVHRSNMTKFIDGKLREDGKWQKGPSYSPPNLQPILEDQWRLKGL